MEWKEKRVRHDGTMKIEGNWHWIDAASPVLILIPRTYIHTYVCMSDVEKIDMAQWLVVNLPHQRTIQKSLWNLSVDFTFPLLHSHVGRSFYRPSIRNPNICRFFICTCTCEISPRNRKRELSSIATLTRRLENLNLTAPFFLSSLSPSFFSYSFFYLSIFCWVLLHWNGNQHLKKKYMK